MKQGRVKTWVDDYILSIGGIKREDIGTFESKAGLCLRLRCAYRLDSYRFFLICVRMQNQLWHSKFVE